MGDDQLPPPATGAEPDERRHSGDTNSAAGSHIGSRLYRDCVEHSPYGVMVHDAAGRILLFNSRLEALLGFRREEIPDVSTWIEKLYPDPAYRRILVKLRGAGPSEGQVRIREALITRQDGQRRMFQFTLATLADETRIIFIRDIHDTAEFIGGRSLVSADGLQVHPRSPIPVFGWVHCEGEFRLAGYNQAAAELAGERLSECLAASAVDFYAEVPEMIKDLKHCFSQRRSLRRIRLLAFPQAAEPRTYEVTFAYSSPSYVFVYLKDLTDLARTQELLAHSEAQFAAFANILPEVVFETDRAGRITFLNRTGIEKLGYLEDEWPERPSAFEFLEPADRPRAAANFRRVMAGEYIGPSEYRARSRDGRTIPILLISCRIERQDVSTGARGFIVDMTAHAEAERALKVSEERLRMATEGAGIALWDWNLKTGEVYCNEVYFRLLGYEPGEFVPSYEKWIELVHPEDRERAAELAQQQLIEGREATSPYSDEYRMRAKDGTWRWIQNFGRVIERDAAGAPSRALGIHIDITERKKSEEALRASEHKFSTTFRAGASAAAIVSLEEGRFIDVNPVVCEMTGYRRAELIGHTTYELNIWADPEDRRRLVRLVTEQGIVRNYEFRSRHKSGELRFGLISAAVISVEGQPCMLSEVVDLTEQRQAEQALRLSEERLRLATEASSLALWDWDADSEAIHCNDIYYTMLGYAPNEFVHSHDRWVEMMHPEDRERALESLAAAKAGCDDTYSEEYRIRCKDGSFRWICDIGRIVGRTADGYARRAIGIHIDITDRKRTEEALKAANDKLEQRVAERTEALLKSNRTLKQQVTRRLAVEKALRTQEKQLKRKSADLMEVNFALKVLLKKREEDRHEVEETIGTHLKDLVLPYLEKLKRGNLSARHRAYVGIIDTNIKEVASPFAKILSDKLYSFTPTEIQVANFIKLDKSNKEIAGYLNLSVKTIEYHRYNIRRKLELIGKPVNLRSYLQTMK